MSTFKLPDLGEGLSDAEIVRWHVAVGDLVAVDQPLLSVETAKAVVEVPSPTSGTIAALHGKPGERVETGAPLVEFSGGENDSGTVVGHMPAEAGEYAAETADDLPALTLQRIQAVPAARALARSLGGDLIKVTGSGAGGLITQVFQEFFLVRMP